MRIYHGSDRIIQVPQIIKGRRVDYGTGFYTTTSYQQAEDWVKTKHQNQLFLQGFVNVYEFDLTQAEQYLRVKKFALHPTEEWFDFVENNRMNPTFEHDWDVVYGPVADDRVFAAFALYESGVLSREETIRELKTYKLKDQYLLHTERALQYITFIEAKEVKL